MLKFKSFSVLDYWQLFDSVELLVSLDASEKLGEYIRKEMKWETVLANRETVRALPHLKIKIAPTLSVFNMRHLPTLYKQSLTNNFIEKDGLYINILDRPIHYNVQVFPENLKKEIIDEYALFFEWMRRNEIPKEVQKQFQECLDYMMGNDKSRFWSKFINETQQLDKMRGEDLTDVLPYY